MSSLKILYKEENMKEKISEKYSKKNVYFSWKPSLWLAYTKINLLNTDTPTLILKLKEIKRSFLFVRDIILVTG